MTSLKYKEQVNLLLEVIEPVLDDNRLALKGGTAINLFTMNLPRFSVDLDLIYLLDSMKDDLDKNQQKAEEFDKEFLKGQNEVFDAIEDFNAGKKPM